MADGFTKQSANAEKTFWGLTLRIELLTLGLFIPFIGYFFLLIGGLNESQVLDFIFCLGYAGFQDFLLHTLLRRLRLLPLLQKLHPQLSAEEARRIKIRLLNYPFFEAWLAPVRWYVGMLTLFLVFATRHDVSTIFMANLFLLPTAGSAIAWYCFFTLSESALADLQATPRLSSVSVEPREHHSLSFSGRFLLATTGLAILILYFFSYILHVPVASQVFHAHPWAHSLGSVGVMLGFALFSGYLTYRSFKPALQETTVAIEAITNGKLSVYVPQFGAHDISGIGHLINEQAGRLREVVGQVRAESEALSTGATRLEKEAADLAREADAQSQSVRHVAQQIHEIAGAISEAKQSMADTVQAIESGFNAISEVSDKMTEIEKQSSEIDQTLGVIDGISSQVNLLALNATIEAARAGAEGRGFAVVADEISKLSDQTKKNSRRIHDSIEAASDRSKKGKVAVSHASQQFEKISEFSGQNAQHIDQIASASGDELARSMGQITSTTGQVVNSSRQVENLANEFRSKAQILEQVVRYFD